MKPRILPLLCAALLTSDSFSQVTIPYSTDFEVNQDKLYPTGNWASVSDSAFITDDESHSGNQSILIPPAKPENFVSLPFNRPFNNSILFVDYYIRSTASTLPDLTSVVTMPKTTSLIAIKPYDTKLGEWAFLDGDGKGSGTWLSAGDTVPLDASNRSDWHRVTLRFNLTSNSWDVFIDGKLLAIDLGTVESFSSGSEAINIFGGNTGNTYLDTFKLTTSNPLFTDVDRDGMDDTIESSYGLNSSVNDRDLDNDLDGLTNIEEYLYGSNPTLNNSKAAANKSLAAVQSTSEQTDPTKLHHGVVKNVSTNWQTIELPENYNSMVVVCSVTLPWAGFPPAVPRVRNASGNSFELKLQNPGNQRALPGYTVHYIVVEEGQYKLADDGIRMEAVKLESSITDHQSSWVGKSVDYLNSYDNPVVLGQVMTVNDDGWSVFWACGDVRSSPPSQNVLKVGKHVGRDRDNTRTKEILGYIVVESGSGIIAGNRYIAKVGEDKVNGTGNYPPYTYNTEAFPSHTGIISAAGIDNTDGGWPVFYGSSPFTNGKLNLAFDKDQIVETRRRHASEQVAYLILSESKTTFSYTVNFNLNEHASYTGGGALVQTIDNGEAATAPEFIVDDGWVFTKWDTAFDSVTSNRTVTAQFAPATYTVRFDLGTQATRTGGGTLTQTVNYGKAATAPTFTVNDGWSFKSWDTTFDSVTSNRTVTAQFVPATYTVSFDLGTQATRTGGGTLTQTVNYGKAATAPEFTVNNNFVFAGWDVEFDNITSNLTIKAQFESESSDTDLLPDDWEILFFNNLGQTELDDADEDGSNNINEYRLGTDPTTPDSDIDSDDIPDALEMDIFGSLEKSGLDDYDEDGIPDIYEIYNHSDPIDSNSIPTPENSSSYFKVDASLTKADGLTFPKISEAETAARKFSYAIIEVMPGTYEEIVPVNTSVLLIGSKGAKQTILNSPNPAEAALTISGSGHFILDGITLLYDKNGISPIEIDTSGETILKNCVIASEETDLTYTFGGGISASAGKVQFINCYMPRAIE